MRLLPLIVLTAIGCDKPCDPETDLSCGAFLTGEAPFAANPAALDGDYVPALANCTVTEFPPDPWFDSDPPDLIRVYDARGRLVAWELDDRDGSSANSREDFTWDGPCLARSEHLLSNTSTRIVEVTERTCDRKGWPTTETAWLRLDDQDQEAHWNRSFDRRYDDQDRLLETETFDVEDTGESLVSTEPVSWHEDHPTTIESLDPDGILTTKTSWKWNTSGLLTDLTSLNVGAATIHQEDAAWTYKGTRLTEHEVDGELRHRWTWPSDGDWPTARVDRQDLPTVLDFDCP